MSLKLKESIQKLRYYDENKKNEPISSFKLIDKSVNKISCFIDLDKESHFLLSMYNETKKINDFRIKTKKWLPYKNRFQMYVVDIPEKIIQSKVDRYFAKNQKKPKLIILQKDEWESYYDKFIGYSDTEGIWC